MPWLCRTAPSMQGAEEGWEWAPGCPQHWHKAACWPPPYLFKCISCNRLESLFHINGLLGTGFKVGDVVFTVAPGLCPFCGDLGGQRAASLPSTMQGGALFQGKARDPSHPTQTALTLSKLQPWNRTQETTSHHLTNPASGQGGPRPRAMRRQSIGLLP